jgi:hypothetical protein
MLLALVAVAVLGLVPAGANAFTKAIWYESGPGGADQFPLYRQLGVGIVEMDLPWNAVAPTRPAQPSDPNDPAYQWPATLDQMISEAAAYHMRVLFQVANAPAWADGGHAGDGWAPRRPVDYANFMTAAARRYPGVHLWMVWGEPVRAGNWRPFVAAGAPGQRLRGAQLGAPHLYARVLDAAYGALKRVSRRNLVIGGNTYTTGLDDPLQWIQNLKLPNGRRPRMDMYGHNPFSYQAPHFGQTRSPFDEVQFSDLHTLARWVDRYLHKRLPLFLSEFTIPTQEDQEFNFWVQPNLAAKWVSQALGASRRWRRIYSLGWVHVYDQPPYSYGGLLNASGQPKPDFYAFERG